MLKDALHTTHVRTQALWPPLQWLATSFRAALIQMWQQDWTFLLKAVYLFLCLHLSWATVVSALVQCSVMSSRGHLSLTVSIPFLTSSPPLSQFSCRNKVILMYWKLGAFNNNNNSEQLLLCWAKHWVEWQPVMNAPKALRNVCLEAIWRTLKRSNVLNFATGFNSCHGWLTLNKHFTINQGQTFYNLDTLYLADNTGSGL